MISMGAIIKGLALVKYDLRVALPAKCRNTGKQEKSALAFCSTVFVISQNNKKRRFPTRRNDRCSKR